jgi:uncharacterized oxidoreductase
MKIKGNTVLITGGATGIGFSLASEFLRNNNEVIICGRREEKLREAEAKLRGIHTKVCDVSKAEERVFLRDWIKKNFESLNILINNAGIQRLIDFRKGEESFSGSESEIETNLTAPAHLISLFIPLLLNKDSAIINISSGLAYKPVLHVPVYCATKAAIHALSVALRKQLQDTSIKIFEIVPPLVDTELDKGRRNKMSNALPKLSPSIIAAAALEALENDEYEIAVGNAAKSILENKTYLEQMSQHYKDPSLFESRP